MMRTLSGSGCGCPRMILGVALVLVTAMMLAIGTAGNAEAVTVEKGTFTTATATGNQTVTLTNTTLQPKAIIFFWPRVTANNTTTVMNETGMGFAAYDGAAYANAGVVMTCDDAVTTSNCGRRRSVTYSVVLLSSGTPALSGQGSVTAMNAGNFVINWQSAPGAANIIHYLAIGGTDVQAKVGNFSLSTATGAQAVTGVGFQPNTVFFLSGLTEAADTNTAVGMFNFGMATGSANQGAISITGLDASAVAGRSMNQQRTDNAIMGMTTAGAQDFLASFTSMDAAGFTVNKSDAPAAAVTVAYLALRGTYSQVGSFNRTTTAGDQAVTGPTFQPEGLLMFSRIAAAGTAITTGTSEIMIGAVDEAATPVDGAMWAENVNATTSDANMISNNTAIYIERSGTTGVVTSNFTSYQTNGFTITHSAAAGTAAQIVYWALGTAPLTAITTCGDCHGQPPVDGTRSAATRATPGSHSLHVTGQGMACTACHIDNGTAASAYPQGLGHREGLIEMAAAISGGTYTRGTSFAMSSNPTLGTCQTTSCHGGNSPTWGSNNPTYDICVKCHGIATSTDAQVTADNNRAAPGYTAASAPVGPGVDTGGSSLNTDAEVGAHGAHLNGSGNISNAVACTECHSVVNFTTASFTNHMNGTHNLSWGTLATTGSHVPAYTAPNCTQVYCHVANRNPGTGAGQGGVTTTTAWNNPALLGGTNLTDTCINKCHAMPPGVGVVGDTHQTLSTVGGALSATVLATCSSQTGGTGCHPSINAGSTTTVAALFFNKAQHIDGTVQGGDCISCHDAAISSPVAQGLNAAVTQRRNVVGEFSSTWSHKRSDVTGNKVDNVDCVVCHMEGNTDGTPNTAVSPFGTSPNNQYHKNGYIELRDPDTGNAIMTATHNGSNPGAYTSNTTPVGFVQFSRNLSSTTLEVAAVSTMINQCLHCHDSNGATVSRVGANALQPFGTAITGHAAPYNSNGQGNVVDVTTSFLTSNASYHPVAGKQNNSYTQGTRMVAPWNMTKTNNNTTSWGYLMTCWDCHAANGATGTLTSTVTAHGGATTVRAPYRAGGNTAAANLCLNCHATTYATTSQNHGSGSAFSTNGSSMGATTTFVNCDYCHGYGPAGGSQSTYTGTTRLLRPVRGEDAHGQNDRDPVAAGVQKWPSGSRPYSFIRNVLSNWHPLSGVGDTITRLTGTTGACLGVASAMCNDNMNPESYSPGGAY